MAAPSRRPAGRHDYLLDGKPRPLAEVAADVSRQANIPIDIDRAAGDKLVSLA